MKNSEKIDKMMGLLEETTKALTQQGQAILSLKTSFDELDERVDQLEEECFCDEEEEDEEDEKDLCTVSLNGTPLFKQTMKKLYTTARGLVSDDEGAQVILSVTLASAIQGYFTSEDKDGEDE